MKPAKTFAAIAATIALMLPGGVASAGPEIQIPDFSHLRSKARDSVDVTIDGALMHMAKTFAKSAADEGDDEAMAFLADIKSVRVRRFEFDTDGVYSKADIDAVRKQLEAPGWSPLVQAHKRDAQEDMDAFICLEDGKIKGFAVIVSEPREFTIVNIVGDIDIDKLANLDGQFGIPRVGRSE